MDFGKALEALKAGKTVRREAWDIGYYLTLSFGGCDEKKTFAFHSGHINDILLDPDHLHGSSILADDWVIVQDVTGRTSDEVLSEFRTWLEKAIMSSCGTPGNGHSYLIQCLDKLDELLLPKSKTVKTPEKCDVKYIDRNHAVAKTESGKYIIVHLF